MTRWCRKLRAARFGRRSPLVLSVLLLPGCYEHVVRVEGPSARTVDVYEPNLKEEHDFVDQERQWCENVFFQAKKYDMAIERLDRGLEKYPDNKILKKLRKTAEELKLKGNL